jgi:hypothetical protein
MEILNILIFTVLILFTFYFLTTTKETFKSTYNCDCGCGCGRLSCQKCNRCPTCYKQSECPTRNMSYDLRGEAYFPPRTNFPFDNSIIGPSNRRCYPNKTSLQL